MGCGGTFPVLFLLPHIPTSLLLTCSFSVLHSWSVFIFEVYRRELKSKGQDLGGECIYSTMLDCGMSSDTSDLNGGSFSFGASFVYSSGYLLPAFSPPDILTYDLHLTHWIPGFDSTQTMFILEAPHPSLEVLGRLCFMISASRKLYLTPSSHMLLCFIGTTRIFPTLSFCRRPTFQGCSRLTPFLLFCMRVRY